MNSTHLKIMTPHGIFMNEDISIVTVKTTEGNIGLQHGKSPFIASVEISELIVSKLDGKQRIAAIAGGLVYVTPETVDIITDAIEWKENIDPARAQRARHDAEIALKNKTDNAEHRKNDLALKRAVNRIHVRQL